MRKVAAAIVLCALSLPSLASAHGAKSSHKTGHVHKVAVRHKAGISVARKTPTLGDPNETRGVASVYAQNLVGHRTASGDRLDLQHFTAASLELPIGTLVTVTNRRNGRQALVRVNDRGPYPGGFLIDLSPAAAAAIGMAHNGTTPVALRVAQR